MQVTTIEKITPDLRIGDCYRDFCFSSTVLEIERVGPHEEYNIDITAPVFDATPELHLWANSKGMMHNVVEVNLFTTKYEMEEGPRQSGTFYRGIDAEIASTTIGPDKQSFEEVGKTLQRLVDRVCKLKSAGMPSPTGVTDE